MSTKLLSGEFVFNNGSAKFATGINNKWHWQFFNEDAKRIYATTTATDSISIVMAKELLENALNIDHAINK